MLRAVTVIQLAHRLFHVHVEKRWLAPLTW
jgi:hypothetical protein